MHIHTETNLCCQLLDQWTSDLKLRNLLQLFARHKILLQESGSHTFMCVEVKE
ncbi:hypothetical protein AHAS_Ahas20G0177100 [Arachis hypogaea]